MPANVFKRLNVSDNFVIPYTANKFWNILSSSFDEKRIRINVGVNHGDTLFKPTTEYFTNNQYDRLVYNSVNLIYYPNFLPTQSSTSSLQNTFYNDGTLSTSSYYNGHVDLGNLDTIKFYPTSSGSVIYAINVPNELTSNKILPTTFQLDFCLPQFCEAFTASIIDDGNYNLFVKTPIPLNSSINTILNDGDYVGNIFYEQNIAILTIIPNIIRLTGWRGNFPYCLDENCANQAFDLATQDLDDITTQQLDDIILQQATGCSPSVTPTVTPTVTTTPTVTPSETPSVTVTPTITITPTVTPSETPSVT
jgi:hypothetical protein